MKKYLLEQLYQVCAWTGALMILEALIIPRYLCILIGIVFIFLNDDKIRGFVVRSAPGIKKKIEEWTK